MIILISKIIKTYHLIMVYTFTW